MTTKQNLTVAEKLACNTAKDKEMNALVVNPEVSTSERKVGKKGFGTAMLEHLKTVDYASTTELATLAGVTSEQAYSRLMFLQSQEKMVVSSGKGAAKVWSLIGKAPPPAPTLESGKVSETVAGIFNKNHGWKPSLKAFPAPVAPVVKGDNLLVEYPQDWRHSALVTVLRTPDEHGVAQCWDQRNKCYAYVPVTPVSAAQYGVKLAVVTGEKNMQILEND